MLPIRLREPFVSGRMEVPVDAASEVSGAQVMCVVSRARRLSPRFGAVVVAMAALASCGAVADDEAATDARPSSTVAYPLPVSETWSTAIEPLGDTGEFIVVDGAADHAGGTGTDVWLADAEGVRLLDRFDTPTLGASGWATSDGAVHVVGVMCDEPEAPEGGPACPEAPLVHLRADRSTVERRELPVRTRSDVGFAAGSAGDELVVTAFRPAAEPAGSETGFHVSVVRDDRAHDLGSIGPVIVCPGPDAATLYPRNLGVPPEGEDTPRVHQVRDTKLDAVDEPGVLDGQMPSVLGCTPDGVGIVQVLRGGVVETWSLRVADGGVDLERFELPEPPPGTAVQFAAGRPFVWAASGRETVRQTLSELVDGHWRERGSVTSFEAPLHTAFSGDVVLAVTGAAAPHTLHVEPVR